MKRILFTLFIGFTSYLNLQSQSQDLPHSQGITWSPVDAFMPKLPRYRFGYIRDIKDHFKIGIDIGVGHEDICFTKDSNKDRFTDDSDNYLLWEIRPEIYYIFRPDNIKTHWYLSLSPYLLHHSESYRNGYYIPLDPDIIFQDYDRVDFERKEYGYAFKVGFFRKVMDRLQLNVAMGFVQYSRNSTFTNLEDNGNYYYPEYDDSDDYRVYEGVSKDLDIHVDFRLYYRLSK